MTKRYFTIIFFIFLIIGLSIPIFSAEINLNPSKTYYYNQEIDLGTTSLPEETFYVNLKITSENRTLFERDFLKEEAFNIPFIFQDFYPSSLTLTYNYFSVSKDLLETKEASLLLTKLNQEIEYFFCNEIECEKELFDVIEENKDFYLSSSIKNMSFTVKITSQDYLKDYKEVSLPLKLNLKEGVYSLEISTILDDSIFSKTLDIIVVSQDQISSPENNPSGLEGLGSAVQGVPSQNIFQKIKSNSLKDNLRSYWYILLIIIILLFLIFKKRKKEPMQDNIKKESSLSRREARKIHLFILLIIISLFSQITFANFVDKEYEFSYFTDDYKLLEKNFPQENEISLYLTNLKQTNSYFLPLINHTNQSLVYSQKKELYQGTLEYTPIYSLFAIDINKSQGNYAPFLPNEQYSQYCKPVLDYFKDHPVSTKVDLINRNEFYLTNYIGFSKECIDELISKRWLQEKYVLAEIKYSPKDFDNQSKIIQEELFFESDLFSDSLTLPINIIKTDSAVVYTYPDPKNYNSIRLEVEENGWILSNRVNYPYSFTEMEKVFTFNLTEGAFGSFRYTLNNYNENYADVTVNYLDKEESLSFSNFLSSSYFSINDGNFNTDVISKLNRNNGHLIFNNYQLYNVVENRRKRRLSINDNFQDSLSVLSRKEYSLVYTPSFYNENNFYLHLNSGKYLNPIIKGNMHLFYDVDPMLFKTIDLFMVNNDNGRYYFSENMANYNYSTTSFLLENDTVKINEIYSSKDYTSFHILFKDENVPIVISTDRKNILSTKDPYFYIYKDYFIMTLNGTLRVYKNKNINTTEKVNTYSNYDDKFLTLTGRNPDFDKNQNMYFTNNLKLFNDYIYDVSTAQDLSLIEQKVFWANSFKKADLEVDDWFSENSFCDSNLSMEDFNKVSENLKRLNFTILKYPNLNLTPFSNVLENTKNYIIPRNTFTKENYDLLCNYTKENTFRNYTNIILNSSEYLNDQNSFIEQLSFFQTPISQIYGHPDNYKVKYLSDYFNSSKEGIIFIDENNIIKGASSLNFKDDYSSVIDFFSNYLVFDRLSIFYPDNLVFSFETSENLATRNYIRNNFLKDKEKLSLKFKLPKRSDELDEDYIYERFIFQDRVNNYVGNCTRLSLDVARKYIYNNVRNFSENNSWWGSDYRREDAWFLAKENQVIWNHENDLPLNPKRVFEGVILGVYIGSTEYTYSPDSTVLFRAGKTFKDLEYTHTMPYLDNYKNKTGITLNAGSRSVSVENAFEYTSSYGRELREIIVPRNFYDNKIKDKYGKTELDYVKEYLTSFD
jgi:hypothetical protein